MTKEKWLLVKSILENLEKAMYNIKQLKARRQRVVHQKQTVHGGQALEITANVSNGKITKPLTVKSKSSNVDSVKERIKQKMQRQGQRVDFTSVKRIK